MNINTISYLVADAFHTMKKDIKNELISLGTMLATMILVAVAYLVYANANVIIENNRAESANIIAFLEVGLTDKEMEEIGFKIKDIQGISKEQKNPVEFKSVQDSIKRAESLSKAILAGYTQEEKESFIPAYYIVRFDDVKAVPGIINSLRKIEGIGQSEDDVALDDYAALAQKKAKEYQIIAITAMIYIVEFSIFLMMNTTKLMMYAKRREISIMKYVGAKDNFIKIPFAIQGVITSLVAVGVTMLLMSLVYPIVISSIEASLLEFSTMSFDLTVLLLIIGFVIGIGGSVASMNKYLDV